MRQVLLPYMILSSIKRLMLRGKLTCCSFNYKCHKFPLKLPGKNSQKNVLTTVFQLLCSGCLISFVCKHRMSEGSIHVINVYTQNSKTENPWKRDEKNFQLKQMTGSVFPIFPTLHKQRRRRRRRRVYCDFARNKNV